MRNSEGSGGPQLPLPEGRLLVWVSGGNFFPDTGLPWAEERNMGSRPVLSHPSSCQITHPLPGQAWAICV